MKVRKGQRSIRFKPGTISQVHSVSWFPSRSGAGGSVGCVYLLSVVERRTFPSSRMGGGIPLFACVTHQRIIFYPSAPCVGEIIVDYSTRHHL